VPLHEQLIKQGFLAFVKTNKEPLFHNEAERTAEPRDPTNPRKPRYVNAREHVAAWVRSLGITDPELSPNHAWGHTFKAKGFRAGLREKVLDAIVGHAPATVGHGTANRRSQIRRASFGNSHATSDSGGQCQSVRESDSFV
jgi:hypothetical protein